MASIADLEQWIAETEIAITREQARLASLIPDLASGLIESQAIGDLRQRLALLHLQRRRLLSHVDGDQSAMGTSEGC